MYQNFLILLLLIPVANSNLFSSTSHLYNALHDERDLAITIRKLARTLAEENKWRKLNTISDKMEEHSWKAKEDPVRYIFNPIGVFLFVKRFTLDWDRQVAPVILEIKSELYVLKINEIRKNLPNYEDLEGVAAAMFRLQDTYTLNATRLAEGFINERYIHALSSEDCYHLGLLAYNLTEYRYLFIWIEIALNKERSEKISNVSRLDLLEYAIHEREMEGDIKEALKLTNKQLYLDPYLQKARDRSTKYMECLNNKNKGNVKKSNSQEYQGYTSLCRGKEKIQIQNKHKLKCYYSNNNNHPFLVLQPAKEEILHISPTIIVYHDIVSERQIDEIKRVSNPLLEKARIVVDGKKFISRFRISKHDFLSKTETTADLKIQKRVEAITGLLMESSEMLQVANYGVGGYYELHRDYIDYVEGIAMYGNRIATWLIYMSNVEEGGATVFPYLGVRISPEKGAAAFWYNLHRNGKPNPKTKHAACPVLIGSKWVATYWIREKEQIFRRPCSIHSLE